MSNIDTRLEKLTNGIEELTELLAESSQQADSQTINLAARFEKFEKDMDAKDEKRWSFFKWAVGITLIVISTSLFIMLERMNAQITVNAQHISAAESQMQNLPPPAFMKQYNATILKLEKAIKALEGQDKLFDQVIKDSGKDHDRIFERFKDYVTREEFLKYKEELLKKQGESGK